MLETCLDHDEFAIKQCLADAEVWPEWCRMGTLAATGGLALIVVGLVVVFLHSYYK